MWHVVTYLVMSRSLPRMCRVRESSVFFPPGHEDWTRPRMPKDFCTTRNYIVSFKPKGEISVYNENIALKRASLEFHVFPIPWTFVTL